MSNLAEAYAARAKTLQGRIDADGFEKKISINKYGNIPWNIKLEVSI